MYKETFLRLQSDSSAETLKDRKHWADIFIVQEEKSCQTKIICSKIIFQKMKVKLRLFEIPKAECSLALDLPYKRC